MVSAITRLLTGSSSLLALAVAYPQASLAQTVEGVRQDAFGADAVNLYAVDASDPPQLFGSLAATANPGGAAGASAEIACARDTTCADPGALVQQAFGTRSGSNQISVNGTQGLHAVAEAQGQTADAFALIGLGVVQLAVGSDVAQNALDADGLLKLLADAEALASAGPALAVAAIDGGLSQIASAGYDGGIAQNDFGVDGWLTVSAVAAAKAESGSAVAGAVIGTAVYQLADGPDGASNELANSGTIEVAADASAIAGGGAVAAASATALGLVQEAQARVVAIANSTTAEGALVGLTTDTPTGPASNSLSNSGSFTVAADAFASAPDGDASATAAVTGVVQLASGSSAEVAIQNSGSLAITAHAEALGEDTPRAVTFVGGIAQGATAIGFSTMETIRPTGTMTIELGASPAGPATASLTNSGTIDIAGSVHVQATGTGSGVEALGAAFVEGLDQTAIGRTAEAVFDNSGSFTVAANVSGHSTNVSNMVAIASGIDQIATAYGGQQTLIFTTSTSTPSFMTGTAEAVGPASASFANSGSIAVQVNVDSHGDALAFAGGTAALVGQSAAGTNASVSLDNSGDLAAHAVVHGEGHSGFAAAGAIGLTQGASGTQEAQALIVNSGTIAVVGSAVGEGEAGGFANATVYGAVQAAAAADLAAVQLDNSGTIEVAGLAQGIADTSAAAFVYASGLLQAASAEAAVEVDFSNSGTFEVLAEASAAADSIAVAAATVRGGIEQIGFAGLSGTGALSIDNSGSIVIAAMANAAAGSTASATAGVSSAIVQTLIAGGGGSVILDNSGSIDISASAAATAAGGEVSDIAFANAYAIGITALASATGTAGSALVAMANEGRIALDVDAHAAGTGIAQAYATAVIGMMGNAHVLGAGDAQVSLTNEGELSVDGAAAATGGHTASALAIAAAGMHAYATGFGAGDAAVSPANSGTLGVRAEAHAEATTNALAQAFGINGVFGVAHAQTGDAISMLANSGTIEIIASAEATALNAQAFAIGGGNFFGGGVYQSALAIDGSATASLDNRGNIAIAANAVANGSVIATANAFGGPGINQLVFATGGDAVADLANSGTISLSADADANATNTAFANAFFYNGLVNFANGGGGGDASAALTNQGSIDIGVIADASAGPHADAYAWATAGVGQFAIVFGGDAAGELANQGAIAVAAEAAALASEQASAAVTIDNAFFQSAVVIGTGEAFGSMENSGSISVAAIADADAGIGLANATALIVDALDQNVAATAGNAQAVFENSGSITIEASAIAAGGSGLAQSRLLGLAQSVSGKMSGIAIDNAGEFSVAAIAEGPDSAAAEAVAISVQAIGTGAAVLTGTIENSGTIELVASAAGAGTTLGSSAVATGIVISSGSNALTLTNSGSISVEAIVDGAGLVEVTGIRAVGNGAVGPFTELFTINNSGDISARKSSDGGASWQRGTAIDAAAAPNATVINLLGGGSIYGDIAVKSGDVINVSGGETGFNGTINPACLPGALDGASSLCGQGQLNIGEGGTLFLRHLPGSDGPSRVFVQELNIAAGGTVALELPTGTDIATADAAYPQIFTDVANLDGTLVVRPATGGLFSDNYDFDNVIDANSRSGSFDLCTIEGYENSALLSMACLYDSGGNVDLRFQRLTFHGVDGLNRNQAAVGSGLDRLYDASLVGPFADMLADLFLFDEAQYSAALNQLTGAQYASYLQSFAALGVRYNAVLDKASECEASQVTGSIDECRTNPLHLWGQLDLADRRQEGDQEAGSYNADQWSAVMGADFNVAPSMLLGASFGKVSNRLNFRDQLGRIEADGMQLGAYAAYDPGEFYVKALGTYGWFDGDGSRTVDWTPFESAFAGRLAGDPDVRLWTLGIHAGARIATGSHSIVTPYFDLDHTNAELKSFAETGLPGANLTVYDSKSARWTATSGLKWAGRFGDLMPQVAFAYRHRFGGARSSFAATFDGDEDGAFDIVSPAEKRGTLIAGFSLGGRISGIDVRGGYQGLFNGDSTTHSGSARIIVPLGRK